ncbi:MAG: hypothetical protein AB8H86_18375 [Polyangiales bacterium]
MKPKAYTPRSASLTIRLGGEAQVALIAYRLIQRMREDAALWNLVAGIRIQDLCARTPLEGLLALWTPQPGWELHRPMIVGHLVAILMHEGVGAGPTRDVVRLVRSEADARAA